MFGMFPSLPCRLSRNRFKFHAKRFQPLNNFHFSKKPFFIVAQARGCRKTLEPGLLKSLFEISSRNISKRFLKTRSDDCGTVEISGFIHHTNPNTILRFFPGFQGFTRSMPPKGINTDTLPFFIDFGNNRLADSTSPTPHETIRTIKFFSKLNDSGFGASIFQQPNKWFFARMTQISVSITNHLFICGIIPSVLLRFSVIIPRCLRLVLFLPIRNGRSIDIVLSTCHLFSQNGVSGIKIKTVVFGWILHLTALKNRKQINNILHQSFGKTTTQQRRINCCGWSDATLDDAVCSSSMYALSFQSFSDSSMCGKPTPWFLDKFMCIPTTHAMHTTMNRKTFTTQPNHFSHVRYPPALCMKWVFTSSMVWSRVRCQSYTAVQFLYLNFQKPTTVP